VEGEAALAGLIPKLDKSMARIIKVEMIFKLVAYKVLIVLVVLCLRFVFRKR
jgi:hypothetical protein